MYWCTCKILKNKAPPFLGPALGFLRACRVWHFGAAQGAGRPLAGPAGGGEGAARESGGAAALEGPRPGTAVLSYGGSDGLAAKRFRA